MKMKNLFLTLLLTAMIFVPAHLSAQVTIGSDRAPSPWSLLDLCTREQQRALHNARMNTEQRDSLMNEDWLPAAERIEAQGLMIFNTDNDGCLEFWNGSQWISLCEGDEPPFITPPHFDSACRENPAFAACFAYLRRFNSTVRQLNDGTPRNFVHPTISAINFNMMPVTGGVFYMGSQRANPAHPNFDNMLGYTVIQTGVHSFYMSQTLVTAELFAAVMGANGTFHGQLLTPVTGLGTQFGTANANIPRNNVSWYDAVVFVNRLSVLLGRDTVYSHDSLDLLNPTSIPTANNAAWNAIRQNLSRNGFRLPTEAEWEYAARGGQRDEYTRTLGASGILFRWSGSNNPDAVAWHAGGFDGLSSPFLGFHGPHQGLSQNQPVGALASNQLGLYDMSGLIWEWNWDWSESLGTCCAVVPRLGPDSGLGRVLRGGSRDAATVLSRVSSRTHFNPWTRSNLGGIRLAFSAVE